MIIGWNKKELLKLKKKYSILLKKAKDVQEDLEISQTLASIDTILDFFKKRRINFSVENKYKVASHEDLMFLKEFGYYMPYIRDFAYGHKYVDNTNIDNKEMYIHNPLLFRMIKEFYSQVSQEYKKEFFNLVSGDKLRLRFIENQAKEAGCTLPVLNTNLIYMYVAKVNSFQDYTTFAHECGHGISAIMNPEEIFSYDRYLFSEVISIFFETIANDYIGESINCKDESTIVKIDTYDDYLHAARMICARLDMLSYLPSRDLGNSKAMTSFFKEYDDLDEEDINVLINKGITEISQYVISYLAVIELYIIYNKDKNKALSILTEMIIEEESDPRKYLEFVKNTGINLGEHVDTYREMLNNEKEIHCMKKGL